MPPSPEPVDDASETPQRASTTKQRLLRALGNLSTVTERLDALAELGFSGADIAKGVGVTPEAVRGWQKSDSPQPRRAASEALDDLRSTALILLEGHLEPTQVRQWFMSRPHGGGRALPRPIDLIRSDPEAVAAAAGAQILQLPDTERRILEDARPPADRKDSRPDDRRDDREHGKSGHKVAPLVAELAAMSRARRTHRVSGS